MSEISDFIDNNIKFSEGIDKYLKIIYDTVDGLRESIDIQTLDKTQFEYVKINNVLFSTFDPYFRIKYFMKEIILSIWLDDYTESEESILLQRNSIVSISVDDENLSILSIDITSK